MLTRKNLMSLTNEEQTRLAKTLAHMSNCFEGNFFEVATMHEQEMTYCPHGKKPQFAYWHRAHVLLFESKLRDSHEALYGDRNISVPYWAWDDAATGQQQVLPPLLRSLLVSEGVTSGSTMRTMLGDDRCQDKTWTRLCRGYTIDTDDEILFGKKPMATVFEKAAAWLRNAGDGKYSFMKASQLLEGLHATVHVSAGFPMSPLDVSGFAVLFYFHHANVDRLWEAWKNSAGNAEMLAQPVDYKVTSSTGSIEVRHFDVTAFQLQPFGRDNVQMNAAPFLLPMDVYDTAALGYMYDALPVTGHLAGKLEDEDDRADDVRALSAPTLTCTNGEEAALAGRRNARAPWTLGKWCMQILDSDLNYTATTCEDWYHRGRSPGAPYRLCTTNPHPAGNSSCAYSERFECQRRPPPPSPPASLEKRTTLSFGRASGCGTLTLDNPSFQAHFFLVPANESATFPLPTNTASLPELGQGHYVGSAGFLGGESHSMHNAIFNVEVFDVPIRGEVSAPELADYVPKVLFSLVGCPCSDEDCAYWNTTSTELLTEASFLCPMGPCGRSPATTRSMLGFSED